MTAGYSRGMDKDFAVQKAGSEANLAKLLGLTRQAVNQWGPTLPDLQVYRLRDMRPKWFAEWKRRAADREAST